jgi:hypothetical protein
MYERSVKKDSYVLKNGFSCRELGGEFVAIADDEEIADPSRVVFLNERCIFLWARLSDGYSLSQMVDALIKKFDIDDEEAEADTGEFIAKLKHAGMVE